MTHKALVFMAPAEPFQIIDRATPKPGPGQVLVKNVAVALNPIDCIIQHLGLWVDYYGYPAIAGCDGAGEIAAIGEGVQGWNIGDRVYVPSDFATHPNENSCSHPSLYEGIYAPDTMAFQEYTLCDPIQVAKVSEHSLRIE